MAVVFCFTSVICLHIHFYSKALKVLNVLFYPYFVAAATTMVAVDIPEMRSPGVDYTCQCAAGYTGSRCEVNVDDCTCQSAVCPNNSMCVDGVNS
jgi:hypothetical protein